jgi:probable F420-dependent oxidoreductase
MRFGVNLHNYGPLGTGKSLVAVTQRAEQLGYDSAWTTDHVLVPQENAEPYGQLLETLITLGYLAGVTSTIELGTSILVLPQRDPVLVAKQAATIAELSAGRLTLGVGVGWLEREFEYLGADFTGRGAVTDEYLQVLQTLWAADGPVSFRGSTTAFSGALFSPVPDPDSRPRIVIGGSGPRAFRRAATFGDGWHAINAGPDQIRAGCAAIAAHEPAREIEISLRIDLALDRGSQDAGTAQPGLHGSREQIAEQISAYEDAGVDHLIVDPAASDEPAFLKDLEDFAGLFP